MVEKVKFAQWGFPGVLGTSTNTKIVAGEVVVAALLLDLSLIFECELLYLENLVPTSESSGEEKKEYFFF